MIHPVTTIRMEAHLLSIFTGLRQQACERWMRHVGIRSVCDLRQRYPGALHADCLTRAAGEIEAFIFNAE
jgi:hypothetical protein